MTDLSWYPKPNQDTGCGFHDSPNYGAIPSDIEAHAKRLRELGISWYKLLTSNNKFDRVSIYRKYDIEPVVRWYSYQPHPHFRPDPAVLKAYVSAGARYIELGNEPNLSVEWSDFSPKHAPEDAASQWVKTASIAKSVGLIPGVYALSPGGDVNHREFMMRFVAKVIELVGKSAFDECFLAVHPRPLNHPPDLLPEYKSPEELGHPPMDTGLWEILWLYDFFVDAVGWCPPMIATEAGYSVGDDQDRNWPKIDINLHYQYNRRMFEYFKQKFGGIKDNKPVGGWPDWFFAACYWLEIDGTWRKDALYPRWITGGQVNDTVRLFAEWILKGGINWERSGSTTPAPSPAPELISDLAIYDLAGNKRDRAWLDDVWGVEIERGQVFHVVEMREYEGPSTQIVKVIDEDGSPLDGITVYRAWPTGSTHAKTVRGEVGFGLGRGDYITAPGEGVSVIKVGLGDKVSRLGMVAGTEHRTLMLTYKRISEYEQTDFVDVVRNAAWQAGGIPYNPEAAFPKFARERGLGNPETREFDFQHNGVNYRGQGFSRGIVYTEVGKWDDLKMIGW